MPVNLLKMSLYIHVEHRAPKLGGQLKVKTRRDNLIGVEMTRACKSGACGGGLGG